MEKSIRLHDGEFILNGKSFFMYSGEVQYFRIKKAAWKDRLLKAKKANLNTIASYIPWCWHESREGIFDFTGKKNPQANVIEFLETLKKLGFYFFARIGPISNAELIHEGIPQWLVKKYPNAVLKRIDNTNPKSALSSYLNPAYQRFVMSWYDRVLPIIEKYQIKNGGPIILVQLCNEIGMLNWLLKQPDYNKSTTRFYQDYLKKRFKNINLLNKRYGTRFKSFSSINQPGLDVTERDFLIHLDRAYFHRDYLSRYYNVLGNKLKEYKIELPKVANIPQFMDFDICGRGYQGITTTTMFRNFKDRSENVIFGGAYQVRRCDFENFHDLIIMNEALKTVSSSNSPRICAEAQFGSFQDRPRLYPKDVELSLKLSVADGLNGINGYVFCGGKNLLNMAFRGTYNEWQAPIDSDGNFKPHLEGISRLGLFLKNFGHLLEKTKKVYDNVSMGFYQPYYATEYMKGLLIDAVTSKRDYLCFDGILRLVLLSGYKFDLFDLEEEPIEILKKRKLIWIFSLDFMDRRTQAKLVEYVRLGGSLIISAEIPKQNLSFKKEDLFIKEFGINDIKVSESDIIFLQDKKKVSDVYTANKVVTFKMKQSSPFAKSYEGACCGAIKRLGKGRLLLSGFSLHHIFDYHIDTAKCLLSKLNAKPSFDMGDTGVYTVLRKNDDLGFLNIFNFDDFEKEIVLNRKIRFKNRIVTFGKNKKIKLAKRSGVFLPVNVPLVGKENARVVYSTCELYKFLKKTGCLELTLYSEIATKNFEMVIECKRPKTISLDVKRARFNYNNRMVKITGDLKSGFQKLKIYF